MPKLHPHIGRASRLRRTLLSLSAAAIAVSVIGIHIPKALPGLSSGDSAVESVAVPAPLRVLSASDRDLYRHIFRLQREGRYDEADFDMARVESRLLDGALLAERYTNPDYSAQFGELVYWLDEYKGHNFPQASDVYHLAVARKPANAKLPNAPETEQAALKGFHSGYEKSQLADAPGGHWEAGLAAYHADDMSEAADHFRALADHADDLPSDDRAAAEFWAYRALLADGRQAEALRYAKRAGDEAPGFYSILARSVTGEKAAPLNRTEVALNTIRPILSDKSIRRAIAFKEIGEDGLAEKELRAIYLSADSEQRSQMSTLASLLNLPGAQMRMALDQASDSETVADSMVYPMPRWKPVAGYKMEPALLFAIMRQESGFNPRARSTSGALGVMQLMPATIQAMAGRGTLPVRSLEPSVSMALGQNYLEHLMNIPFIGDNLVFVAAAYNAGPGTLQNWQRHLRYDNDPLLFVESIPFRQTRDYIERVVGNYWVYSKLMGVQDVASVAALAEGNWPRYGQSEEKFASMQSRLGGGR